MKKITFFLLISLFIFVLLLIFVIITFKPAQKQQAPENSLPIPTPVKINLPTRKPTIQSEEIQSDDYSLTPQEQEQARKNSLVADLINATPYKGSLFMLDYDFDKAIFVLTLNKNSEQEGNLEFDNFLNQHNVQRSWITNLQIEYN